MVFHETRQALQYLEDLKAVLELTVSLRKSTLQAKHTRELQCTGLTFVVPLTHFRLRKLGLFVRGRSTFSITPSYYRVQIIRNLGADTACKFPGEGKSWHGIREIVRLL